VDGPGGTSLPVSRTITVASSVALTVNAGPDQTSQRGTVVTLDASATAGAQSLTWTRTAGPTMQLPSTTASKPTFSYPLMALPTAPVGSPNPSYVPENAPLTFRLTAIGVDGITTAFDDVVVSPTFESVSGVTAGFRTVSREWRVTGTSTIHAGQRVTVVLGPLATGRTIGTAAVDNVGAFSIRAGALPDPTAPATAATQVTLVSQTGLLATVGITITT
jgi:hypothetical protein